MSSITGLSVVDAMVAKPLTHPVTTTIDEAREAFEDPHLHLLLIVSGRRLLGTIERGDLSRLRSDAPTALGQSRLEGRSVGPDESLATVHAEMVALKERRRAVVDAHGNLVGLLCLKASGAGFCSDEGVAARSRDRTTPTGLNRR